MNEVWFEVHLRYICCIYVEWRMKIQNMDNNCFLDELWMAL